MDKYFKNLKYINDLFESFDPETKSHDNNKKINIDKNTDSVLCSDKFLPYDKNLSFERKFEETIKINGNSPRTKKFIFNKINDKENFIGNFKIEIDKKYNLEDIIESIEINICNEIINCYYPSDLNFISQFEECTQKTKINKHDKVIYRLPGMRFIPLFKYVDVCFKLKFKNSIGTSIKFTLDFYNNFFSNKYDGLNAIIPYYESVAVQEDNIENAECVYTYYTIPTAPTLCLNLKLFNENTGKCTKKLSDHLKKIHIYLNGYFIYIDNDLIQQFEKKFGNGIIPFTKQFKFKNQIRESLNLSEVDNFRLGIYMKNLEPCEYNKIKTMTLLPRTLSFYKNNPTDAKQINFNDCIVTC